MAIDASGKLYVANGPPANNVRVFDTVRGNAALSPITGSRLSDPQSVTVDASGMLHVGNWETDRVSVFDTIHGNTALPRSPAG